MMISTGEAVGGVLPTWFDGPCAEGCIYNHGCMDGLAVLHFNATVDRPSPAVIIRHVDERLRPVLQDLRERAESGSMEFPCKLHGLSCDQYRAFRGTVECTQHACLNSIVSVTTDRRPSWTQALLSSVALLAYYEIFATGVVLGIFLLWRTTSGEGRGQVSVGDTLRIVSEASSRQEIAALRRNT
eukprot:UN1407